VSYDLDVPVFDAAPLALSGLAITSPGAETIPTAKQDPVLGRTLPAPPTTTRRFTPGAALTAYVEVYGGGPATPGEIDVVTSVRGPDGRERVVTQERTSAAEMRANGGGVGYALRVPLTGTSPGTCTLRVEARARTGGAGSVVREVPFVIE
jgi:hypothetical protein